VNLTVRVCRELSSVDAASWDALDHGGSPFLEFGFLRALEESGSIGRGSGWAPVWVLVEASDSAAAARPGPPTLVGAVACFIKSHSYGEYIFDWSWASASTRAGIPYYPKLVVAAPMTPASGPRLLLPRDADPALRRAIAGVLCDAVRSLAQDLEVSSVHWLFTTADEQALLEAHGFKPRASFQFHWRNAGYATFDDFLATLASRKRKQIRKERARAMAEVDALEFVPGDALTAADLDHIDRFYRVTTAHHGGRDYLRPGFFHALAQSLPHRMVWARVRRAGATVAGALYFETPQALYGRYWGADEDIPFLHFETAYYAGIERCIARGTPLFEAGAQGEHKLLRGFAPAPTHSSHWILDPRLRDAVERFLEQEADAMPTYIDELEQLMPYKRGPR